MNNEEEEYDEEYEEEITNHLEHHMNILRKVQATMHKASIEYTVPEMATHLTNIPIRDAMLISFVTNEANIDRFITWWHESSQELSKLDPQTKVNLYALLAGTVYLQKKYEMLEQVIDRAAQYVIVDSVTPPGLLKLIQSAYRSSKQDSNTVTIDDMQKVWRDSLLAVTMEEVLDKNYN